MYLWSKELHQHLPCQNAIPRASLSWQPTKRISGENITNTTKYMSRNRWQFIIKQIIVFRSTFGFQKPLSKLAWGPLLILEKLYIIGAISCLVNDLINTIEGIWCYMPWDVYTKIIHLIHIYAVFTNKILRNIECIRLYEKIFLRTKEENKENTSL